MNFAGSYNGLAFGPGSNFPVQSIDGWFDLPNARLMDVLKSQDHGAFIGPEFLGERQILLQLWVQGNANFTFDQLVAQLQQAFQISQVEIPFLGNGSTQQSNARCTRRKIPIDPKYAGFAAEASIELMASDPRLYNATQSSASTGIGTSGTGFTFPFTFPFTFDAGQTGNTFVATNNGNFPTNPIATIQGPVTNPGIQNVTQGLSVIIDITLSSTDTLVVDFNARTVILNGQASRRNALDASSRWWSLPPGASTIKFLGASGTGATQLTLTWRDATV